MPLVLKVPRLSEIPHLKYNLVFSTIQWLNANASDWLKKETIYLLWNCFFNQTVFWYIVTD